MLCIEGSCALSCYITQTGCQVDHNSGDVTIRRREGSENVASKMNLRSFNLYRDYSNSRSLSSVCESSRS